MQSPADLVNAAEKGDLRRVRRLLRLRFWGLVKNIDVNAKDKSGRTALHLAAQHGHQKIVIFLLQKGADVNAQDLIGATPLCYAAKGDHREIAALLIENGAPLQQDGITIGYPLDWAVSNRHPEMVAFLIAKGADVNAVNATTFTALHMAVTCAQNEIVKLLLENGANVNAKDKDGNTPLAFAARDNQKDLLALLIERGGDVSVRNNDGYTLLDIALLKGHDEIARMLERQSSASLDTATVSREVEVEIRGLIQQGEKIKAIRRIRELTGWELMKSKEYVDGLGKQTGPVLLDERDRQGSHGQENNTKEKRIEAEQKQTEISALATELLEIGQSVGYLSRTPGGNFDHKCRNIRAREIGQRLNELGGFDLMSAVHGKIQSLRGSARDLESCWGYIGKWLP